jgi:O-antigen/teichoic acid export membrane protein
MDISPVVFLIPILTSLGLFAMIFGIVYMHKKENLAMIEKGMNPKIVDHRPMPYRNLKWGLLLVGSGIGLFLAYVLDNYVLYRIGHHGDFEYDNNVAIYFALIAIGGGLGLITSYRIEKKELLNK